MNLFARSLTVFIALSTVALFFVTIDVVADNSNNEYDELAIINEKRSAKASPGFADNFIKSFFKILGGGGQTKAADKSSDKLSNSSKSVDNTSTDNGLNILGAFGGLPGIIGALTKPNSGINASGNGGSNILDAFGGLLKKPSSENGSGGSNILDTLGIPGNIGALIKPNSGYGSESQGSNILDSLGGLPGIVGLLTKPNSETKSGKNGTNILDMLGGIPGIVGVMTKPNSGNNGTSILDSFGGLPGILGLLAPKSNDKNGQGVGSNTLDLLGGLPGILSLFGGSGGSSDGSDVLKTLLGGTGDLSGILNQLGNGKINIGSIVTSLIGSAGLANIDFVNLIFGNNMTLVKHVLNVLYEQGILLPDNLDRVCYEDMRFIVDQFVEVLSGHSPKFIEDWSVKLIDSIGKPGQGITTGNLYWMGNFRQCLAVTAKRREKHRSFGDPKEFIGEYCMTTVSIKRFVFDEKLPFKVDVKWAMCFPSTCSYKNKQKLLNHWANVAKGYLQAEMKPHFCQTKIKDKLDGISICAIVIISLIATIVVVGTLCDIWWQHRYSDESTTTIATRSPGKGLGSLMAFSAIKSLRKIFHIREEQSELSALHGIRCLSMLWVIFCHMIMPMTISYPWKNHMEILHTLEDKLLHPYLLGGPFVVDTFFTISGFLVSYLFFKEMVKKDGKVNILEFYAYRIFRLIPSYSLIILFLAGPYIYIKDSPVWPALWDIKDACEKSWWKNLLFIQNMWDRDLEVPCLPPSWYLAVDSQLYFIAPIFIYPLFKRPKIGICITTLGFLIGTFLPMGLIIYHKYETFAGLHSNFNTFMKYIMEVYFKPWAHLSTFVVGIATGYILTVFQGRKIKVHMAVILIGWLLTLSMYGAIFFGLSDYLTGDKIMGFPMQVAYGSLFKIGWSLGLSFIIWACACGYGGFVNSILSMRIFFTMSRLTYAMYLTHYLAVSYYYASQDEGIYFSYYQMFYATVSTVLVALVLAIILAVLIEMPMMELGNVLGGQSNKTGTNGSIRSANIVRHGVQPRLDLAAKRGVESDSDTESSRYSPDRKPLMTS